MMKVIINYKKSISSAVENKMKELAKNNIVPSFEIVDTIDNGNNNYTLRLIQANYKQCATWIVKEYESILDKDNKQVIVYI